jgi:hypothetical protein
MRDAAAPARTDEDCWWDAVLSDPRAVTSTPSPARTLGEIRSELLRVECLRCFRIVEIQRLDAVRLYGPHAIWKDVGHRPPASHRQSRGGGCCRRRYRSQERAEVDVIADDLRLETLVHLCR